MAKTHTFKTKNQDEFWEIVNKEYAKLVAWKKAHPKAPVQKLVVELKL